MSRKWGFERRREDHATFQIDKHPPESSTRSFLSKSTSTAIRGDPSIAVCWIIELGPEYSTVRLRPGMVSRADHRLQSIITANRDRTHNAALSQKEMASMLGVSLLCSISRIFSVLGLPLPSPWLFFLPALEYPLGTHPLSPSESPYFWAQMVNPKWACLGNWRAKVDDLLESQSYSPSRSMAGQYGVWLIYSTTQQNGQTKPKNDLTLKSNQTSTTNYQLKAKYKGWRTLYPILTNVRHSPRTFFVPFAPATTVVRILSSVSSLSDYLHSSPNIINPLSLKRWLIADLKEALWSRSPNAEIWIKRRTNFARTIGVGSTYPLGFNSFVKEEDHGWYKASWDMWLVWEIDMEVISSLINWHGVHFISISAMWVLSSCSSPLLFLHHLLLYITSRKRDSDLA